jgi:hypothetical protein
MRGRGYAEPFVSPGAAAIRLYLAVYGRRRVKARFLEDLPPVSAGR